MITVRELLQNLQAGQSSIRVRAILGELEAFRQKVQKNIKIVYAKHTHEGTIVYFKVPSENKNIHYDVVFWFDTQDRLTKDTKLKVYSNTKFFVFNLGYVFYKNGSLLFPHYYPSEVRTIKPKIRNPLMVSGFDKHVYAALKTVVNLDLSGLVDGFKTRNEPSIKKFAEKVKEEEALKKQGKLDR